MKTNSIFEAMRDIDPQYIVSAAPRAGRASGFAASRIRVAAIAACMALIMIAAAVILPYSRRSAPPPETQSPAVSDPASDDTTADPETVPESDITTSPAPPETTEPITQPSDTDPPVTTEPPETGEETTSQAPATSFHENWLDNISTPWAIAEIIEVTNETKTIRKWRTQKDPGEDVVYYKVKCNIIYNFHADVRYFSNYDSNYYAIPWYKQPNDARVFNQVKEIYVPAFAVDEISKHDGFLFSMDREDIYETKEYIYTLWINRKKDDVTGEYNYRLWSCYPINDGKLDCTDRNLGMSFNTFNREIERVQKKIQNGEILLPYEKEHYHKTLEDGMTIEEMKAYFTSFVRAYEILKGLPYGK